MNKMIVFARTAKGTGESGAGSHELARDLRIILNAIDGKSSVEILRNKFDFLSPAELDEALAALAAEYFIREAAGSPAAFSSSPRPAAADGGTEPATPQSDESLLKAQALRAKIRGRREGAERRSAPEAAAGEGRQTHDHEQASRVAEEQARLDEEARRLRAVEEAAQREAAERARQDAEAQQRSVAEERARREAEELARRHAQELARREEAERLRQEAEAQARRAAEEESRQRAEEEARARAAQQARERAEEESRRQAEEEARRQEAESVRQDAEEHARWMAEQQAWRETEEKNRADQEATARKRASAREAADAGTSGPGMLRRWGKAIALGLVALVAAGLVTLHVISFDGQIPKFEKALAAQFQQPVTIKALRLSLVPHSQLRLEGVSIGSEGQIRIPQIRAAGTLGNLFSDRKVFTSLALDSPVVAAEGMGWILFGKPLTGNLEFGQVAVLNATFESKHVNLPAFDAKLQSDGAGAWKAISVESVDKNLNLELTPQDSAVQIDFKARTFKVPFGSALTLEEVVARGTADGSGLVLTEFKGFAYGGTLAGAATLKWGASWSLQGELHAKQIDASRLVPELLADARLVGDASFVMQAPQAAKLFAEPRLEGSFLIPRGTLLGVDLGRALQGGGMRGDTKFSELAGSILHERGATQLRQIRLSQGPMLANGSVDVDADRTVRGRIAAEIRSSVEYLRARLALSGTVGKIEWARQ